MHLYPFLTGALACLITSSYAAATVTASEQYDVVEQLQRVPDGWVQGSRPQPSMLMQFRLAIRQPRAHEFEQLVMKIATPGNELYGQHMKRDDVKAFLQPTAESSEAVLSWLQSEDVSENLIDVDGDWVKFIVPVKQAEKMLNTTFYIFHDEENSGYRVRTLEYSVPHHVHKHVQLIQPTTHFGRMKPQRSWVFDYEEIEAPNRDVVDCSSYVTPDCLRQLYRLDDFTATPDPRNKLGISGYLEQYARYDDLEGFLQQYAPNMTDGNFTVQSINGGMNEQSSDDDSTEASLDIQYGIALAYNVPTIFFTTGGRGPLVPDLSQPDANDSSNEPYLEQLQYLLNLPDEDLPSVLSTSYGENEQTLPESYTNTTCSLFAQLGARGVSIIFSSGDEGVGSTCLTNDGTNQTRFNPIYPASCPFVTAVGGTYDINPEKAISFSSGGFSERFSRPSYQDQAVSSYLSHLGDTWKGLYNPEGRGFPDVAAQSHSFIVQDHGKFIQVDGTSASAPTFAAIIADLNSVRLSNNKSTLGFLNPWIYSLNGSGFTDIVDGAMSDLKTFISQLHKDLELRKLDHAVEVLSQAKRALLQQNALFPSTSLSPQVHAQAREILELGAITSLRLMQPPDFTRYYQQLQPFYDLEREVERSETTASYKEVLKTSQRSKITGLYLLLLLSSGDTSQFHTVLEGLIVEASLKGYSVEDDPFIKYPVELERSLMEGSYDKVWRATKSSEVPTEDFGLFSDVLVGTIRREIADCSEQAYQYLPISNAKNLLFLDSEGAVVEFAQERGWTLKDGNIYFPAQVDAEAGQPAEKGIGFTSATIIQNTIGYARELETIV
ncbi:peptidase S8/S53 domain-containing protein [Talaromyces proteolyticus]|uniref:tripeptidyl-peptidase II n=1 Tax=Talaromyces proteolyticus TaxID=1131652 RepID=A0AAD4KMW1_9EURO|nr:peptidase S8/S53 domain-containing protein [Talaromyces proteolyticus]KAH8693965.1 peptidase S8/S53 domain-containing protein [Talaromyces proteolyticus]